MQTAPEVLPERDVAAGRHPAEADRENEDQHQGEPEVRQGQAQKGDRHHRAVDPAVLADSGEHASGDSHDHRHRDRIGGESEGDRQAVEDRLDHRPVEREGAAEIALEQIAVPDPDLDQPGAVQAELGPNDGDLGRPGRRPGDHMRRVAGNDRHDSTR